MSALFARSSRRRLTAFGTLVAASASGTALVASRFAWTGEVRDANLVWTLTLARVPFVLALLVYDRARRGPAGATLPLFGAAWLAFLPNSPYLWDRPTNSRPRGSSA